MIVIHIQYVHLFQWQYFAVNQCFAFTNWLSAYKSCTVNLFLRRPFFGTFSMFSLTLDFCSVFVISVQSLLWSSFLCRLPHSPNLGISWLLSVKKKNHIDLTFLHINVYNCICYKKNHIDLISFMQIKVYAYIIVSVKKKRQYHIDLTSFLHTNVYNYIQLAPTFAALIPARRRSRFALACAAAHRSTIIIIKKKNHPCRESNMHTHPVRF